MKIKITVCRKGNEDNPSTHWEEELITEDTSGSNPEREAEVYALGIVDAFNDSLRPEEEARTLIKSEVIDDTDSTRHRWEKTNLVTKEDRRGTYDAYECARCGITGKRRALEGSVIIDNKYKMARSCTGRRG